ncbi:homogentisate 1,2-dioxygenase [Flexibacter flexilis DSM 6793]|uniref:Homogentisate 1,2-dioxygenase n=1 Tax=Flexibacter flexilis DSM 6793 TaxID=927664 RepID=A0A1I1MVR0_9BACT|nr:homogentisate 1,2-dioxygenase [Flexibacter flexilis]SFC89449.1 homogentisate 1,2-dioxygenase [Flexibacter flexilis DSM 6793]
MCYYYKLGQVPHKRHIQFRQPDGSLYQEELVSSLGFSGIYSNLYHVYAPTKIKRIEKPVAWTTTPIKDFPLQPIHLKTCLAKETGSDFLQARLPMLMNNDVTINICNPSVRTMDYFYKNGEADELIFVHDGAGYLYSQFGKLRFEAGDYIVIPRTTIYKMEFDENPQPVRLLVVESASPIETVSRYRNELGQLLEHSPYCERDIRPPAELVTETEKGEYLVKIKKQGFLHQYVYEHSPLDVVGWDGFLYPYCISIHDFEPITGRIHQPPPVHQMFQAAQFVICSFVPRLFDYHPLAIPAPYNHSNIDSDEVLYYVEGNFMSRKGVERASFTLHPGGLPHGPHPGTIEASIGKKETIELAVMIDTFKPLWVTQEALTFVDENYPMSWNS